MMDRYEELFRISKILLSEKDDSRTAEHLLRRVIEQSSAERGFIVIREDVSYQQRFEIHYDRARLSQAERRFSRTLVREAIETGKLIYIPNLLTDERFQEAESAPVIGRCCILAAPLTSAGEIYGVIYLENREQSDSFSLEHRAFLTDFAEVAGHFIRRALDRQTLVERNRSLERDLLEKHDFGGIVARHPKMLEVLKLVAQVADSEATVLVRGETGTGKELIARALHVNSSRREGPLVTLHCSALPTTLFEAELFGHAAGAYTDAKRSRRGRLAAAHNGTLLLDEVAEIPLEVQAKLLRFLQFGEIQRVGTDQVERVDVRIVTATHADLWQLCHEGKFRRDLYFRLKVIEVELPSLRQRRSDIPLLLEHFLRRHWRRLEERPRWTSAAAAALRAYDYPGNVRELEHLVERACLLATGGTLDLDLLPTEVASMASGGGQPVAFDKLTREELSAAREERIAEVEREFLRALMEGTAGNVSQAARESGLHRSYLQKLLARHRPILGDLARKS